MRRIANIHPDEENRRQDPGKEIGEPVAFDDAAISHPVFGQALGQLGRLYSCRDEIFGALGQGLIQGPLDLATFFSALGVLDGKDPPLHARLQRHQEFIRFLNKIEQENPPGSSSASPSTTTVVTSTPRGFAPTAM